MLKNQISKRIAYGSSVVMMVLNGADALADSGGGFSLGDVANNLMSLEGNVNSFINAVVILTGTGLIAGSLLQFRSHWKNPVQTGLGKPIALLLLGVALFVLAFIPMPKFH